MIAFKQKMSTLIVPLQRTKASITTIIKKAANLRSIHTSNMSKTRVRLVACNLWTDLYVSAMPGDYGFNLQTVLYALFKSGDFNN